MRGTDSEADPPGDGPEQRPGMTTYRWGAHSRGLGVVFLLGTLAGFWRLGGTIGLLIWGVVAASWLVLPPTVPVAIGQVGLVAVTSADTTLPDIVLAEIALLGILGVDGINRATWPGPATDGVAQLGATLTDVIMYAGTAAVLGVFLVSVAERNGLLAAVVAGSAIVGVAAYGLHRYLLVALGEVSERPNG